MKHESKKAKVIRPQQYSAIEYMTGPSPKGPKRCIHCHKFFQKDESWQRITSPADPKYGTYSFGIHAGCIS